MCLMLLLLLPPLLLVVVVVAAVLLLLLPGREPCAPPCALLRPLLPRLHSPLPLDML
jgi:hypothetical protein